MALIDHIKDELKQAMRDKNQVTLTTLRGLTAAFTNELVATGKTPQDTIDDALAMMVIKRQAKQRKDAIEQFVSGGREDLAQDERAELEVLEQFLPETMSQDEIRVIAEAKKSALGIADKSGMGQLMGALMAELKDKADGGDVKAVADSLFE